MNYLISAYSVNPYHGSEDGVGWNWVLQYEKNWKPGDIIIVLTKRINEEDTRKGMDECGIKHVKIETVDVPLCLNWYREKHSMFHHMYYIFWQHWAWLWVKKSEIHFDVIHHVTMGDYRILGEMYKAKNARTIFGPVGGAQSTPKALNKYEKNIACAYFRRAVNYSCGINPLYRRRIRKYSEVYLSNSETYKQIALLRKGLCTKQMVEIGISKEMKDLHIMESESDKCPTILFVGRLIDKKGIFFLIEAARILAKRINFKLVIVGGGYLEKKIRNTIKKYNLEKYIILLGEISHRDVTKEYKNADVFAFPSLRETGGTVLIEAMASGLPVVAFNMSFCKELAKNDCGIFIDTNQPLKQIREEYANAISRLIMNKPLRSELGMKGYHFVNIELTWERKYNTVYKSVY